ncbi:MAG TPA: choice-of-anchor Q domain-containing protein [Desulfobacteraceae bacterium]|nr:choice-of-anchor Q domain-containing protein [Desulfobacteraceae bacterium]HPJ66650.1 choice-of-anchor Q domain-containing protein [Desulfobacteraceae bacterium]HPQ27769.1 choice-of-anchor Q domain-containing protein [Desulfobacteraceae bacterium]
MKKVLFLAVLFVAAVVFLPRVSLSAPPWTVYCVDPCGGGDYTDLQSALEAAESNSNSVLIKVAQGTYTGNFEYESSQGYSITIYGGYEQCTGCATRELDPANTILDGNFSGNALIVTDNSGGDICVDGFTLRNGSGATAYYGGGVKAASENDATTGDINSGNITITNNIVTGNAAVSNGGGVYASSQSNVGAAGNIIVNNNIIHGNSVGVSGYDGGGVMADSYSSSGTAGNITMTNNLVYSNSAGRFGEGVAVISHVSSGTAGTVTLTNNTITENCDSGICYGLFMSGQTVNCYNNIVWANTDYMGADIYLNPSIVTAQGCNNDYETIFGSWDVSGSNISANPRFTVSYHLRPGSPCIDTGKNDPPGGLPSTDFEGDQRIIDGNHNGTATVDIGADEYIPKGSITSIFLLLLE